MPTYYDDLLECGVPTNIPSDGFTFEDVFDEHIASTQKTWSHDRSKSVGASESFGCIRKTWFGKRGKEFGHGRDVNYEENWGAMRRGDLIENYHIVPAVRAGLERRGLALIMEGDDQETIVDGNTSATLDGLVIPVDPALNGRIPKDFLAYYGLPEIDTDSVVLEMKSIDPRLMESMMHEKPIHRGQTQIQMGLIRETTDYKPTHGVILYINASWLSDMRPYVIPFDEQDYKTARLRNDTVFAENDPGRLPAEGKLDGDCRYCPFNDACASVSAARVPNARPPLTKKQIDEQDMRAIEEMDSLVYARMEVKREEKDAARRVEEMNEKIRIKLIDMGESRAADPDGSWKVTYTRQPGAKRLSARLLEEAGLDPEDFKEAGGGFEKLTVTAK